MLNRSWVISLKRRQARALNITVKSAPLSSGVFYTLGIDVQVSVTDNPSLICHLIVARHFQTTQLCGERWAFFNKNIWSG